jgi:DNA-binding GntR family transcriptional regulator
MRALVEQGVEAARTGNLTELPALNTRFHALLAATARNEMLAETIERLRHLIEWIYSQRIAQRAPRSWQEHSDIVDAIARGDSGTAERVARAHISMARDAYVELQPSPTAPAG